MFLRNRREAYEEVGVGMLQDAIWADGQRMSDEAYRDQFFTTVKKELDRAVAVRTLYLELRDRDPAGNG